MFESLFLQQVKDSDDGSSVKKVERDLNTPTSRRPLRPPVGETSSDSPLRLRLPSSDSPLRLRLPQPPPTGLAAGSKALLRVHRAQHDLQPRPSESSEVRPDWKPPFLSNQEFAQLMMEVTASPSSPSGRTRRQTGSALDGFFVALQPDGNILYASDGVAPLLEHLPADLVDQNLLDFLPAGEHAAVAAALCSHATEGGAPPYPAGQRSV
ncbi:Circadian locomoter output cycles protein kaput [Liparis tanakae]|uniref:Circadian locomoter output cycles protein kaput n=1 Tax=Liparis tanakae TaxID=230148 RepID=A0A4Z2EQS4_9TELE|nr:Circadian locomoter output cycles protein kaput [Liparis tanakae]